MGAKNMSRETEKMFKGLHEFMAKNISEDMSEEDMKKMVDEYMCNQIGAPTNELTEKNAQTSDDFLELAMDAENEATALKYAKKALKLDPDNLDAEAMIADITSENDFDYYKKLKRIVEHGNKVIEKNGFLEDVGHFWGVIETRPYMRVRHSYIEALIACRMMTHAIDECEDMLRLSENDNLGIRYILMHLYAYVEDETKALELHKKYEGNDETQMLLPLAMIYFKLEKWEQAEKYLKKLSKANKDTKKFIKAVLTDSLDREAQKMNSFGYAPFSIEEFVTEFAENSYLFRAEYNFFIWADGILKSK